jgi:acyl-CoA synthetase (AMP-forming)/AMP-acid ligase II
VVSDESIGAEAILQECRSKLSAFEVPQRLEIIGALPHTAKGALDRRAVEVQYAP